MCVLVREQERSLFWYEPRERDSAVHCVRTIFFTVGPLCHSSLLLDSRFFFLFTISLSLTFSRLLFSYIISVYCVPSAVCLFVVVVVYDLLSSLSLMLLFLLLMRLMLPVVCFAFSLFIVAHFFFPFISFSTPCILISTKIVIVLFIIGGFYASNNNAKRYAKALWGVLCVCVCFDILLRYFVLCVCVCKYGF